MIVSDQNNSSNEKIEPHHWRLVCLSLYLFGHPPPLFPKCFPHHATELNNCVPPPFHTISGYLCTFPHHLNPPILGGNYNNNNNKTPASRFPVLSREIFLRLVTYLPPPPPISRENGNTHATPYAFELGRGRDNCANKFRLMGNIVDN